MSKCPNFRYVSLTAVTQELLARVAGLEERLRLLEGSTQSPSSSSSSASSSMSTILFSPGAELVVYTPTHGDDLAFIVNEKTVEDAEGLSEEERLTSRHMIRYWTNFAKYGEPSPVGRGEVPTWYPVTPTTKVSLTLDWLDLIQCKTVENGWIFQLKTIKGHFYSQLENF